MAALVSVPPGTKVGILTSGGLAPCLSAAVGYLIEKVRQPKKSCVYYDKKTQQFALYLSAYSLQRTFNFYVLQTGAMCVKGICY